MIGDISDMDNKILSAQVNMDDFIPATEEEKEYMVQMRPSSTFFKDSVKRLLKNKVATVCFFIIVLITLAAIFVPMFWPYAYDQALGVIPGKPVDNTFNDLAPFEYGKAHGGHADPGQSGSQRNAEQFRPQYHPLPA